MYTEIAITALRPLFALTTSTKCVRIQILLEIYTINHIAIVIVSKHIKVKSK